MAFLRRLGCGATAVVCSGPPDARVEGGKNVECRPFTLRHSPSRLQFENLNRTRTRRRLGHRIEAGDAGRTASEPAGGGFDVDSKTENADVGGSSEHRVNGYSLNGHAGNPGRVHDSTETLATGAVNGKAFISGRQSSHGGLGFPEVAGFTVFGVGLVVLALAGAKKGPSPKISAPVVSVIASPLEASKESSGLGAETPTSSQAGSTVSVPVPETAQSKDDEGAAGEEGTSADAQPYTAVVAAAPLSTAQRRTTMQGTQQAEGSAPVNDDPSATHSSLMPSPERNVSSSEGVTRGELALSVPKYADGSGGPLSVAPDHRLYPDEPVEEMGLPISRLRPWPDTDDGLRMMQRDVAEAGEVQTRVVIQEVTVVEVSQEDLDEGSRSSQKQPESEVSQLQPGPESAGEQALSGLEEELSPGLVPAPLDVSSPSLLITEPGDRVAAGKGGWGMPWRAESGSRVRAVLVPAVVEDTQAQSLSALRALKVVEDDVDAAAICTRRQFARWLVRASTLLNRDPQQRIVAAMFVEGVTAQAYDDVPPEDPDFASIQGLAETGLLSSKLSLQDLGCSRVRFGAPVGNGNGNSGVSGGSNSEGSSTDSLASDSADASPTRAGVAAASLSLARQGCSSGSRFFPDSSVTRQDLVTWKSVVGAVNADLEDLHKLQAAGMKTVKSFMDASSINEDAVFPIALDLGKAEGSIFRTIFGLSRRFDAHKPVTCGQVAVALALGDAGAAQVVSEELARLEMEQIAAAAVRAAEEEELSAREVQAAAEAAAAELMREEEQRSAAAAAIIAEAEQEKDVLKQQQATLVSLQEAARRQQEEASEEREKATAELAALVQERQRVGEELRHAEMERVALLERLRAWEERRGEKVDAGGSTPVGDPSGDGAAPRKMMEGAATEQQGPEKQPDLDLAEAAAPLTAAKEAAPQYEAGKAQVPGQQSVVRAAWDVEQPEEAPGHVDQSSTEVAQVHPRNPHEALASGGVPGKPAGGAEAEEVVGTQGEPEGHGLVNLAGRWTLEAVGAAHHIGEQVVGNTQDWMKEQLVHIRGHLSLPRKEEQGEKHEQAGMGQAGTPQPKSAAEALAEKPLGGGNEGGEPAEGAHSLDDSERGSASAEGVGSAGVEVPPPPVLPEQAPNELSAAAAAQDGAVSLAPDAHAEAPSRDPVIGADGLRLRQFLSLGSRAAETVGPTVAGISDFVGSTAGRAVVAARAVGSFGSGLASHLWHRFSRHP